VSAVKMAVHINHMNLSSFAPASFLLSFE